MRISDWSSDVCSSDLRAVDRPFVGRRGRGAGRRGAAGGIGAAAHRQRRRHLRPGREGSMTVHFIGAGPGAADLITVRGRDIMARAPVCLYAGSIVPKELLVHCPLGARIVDNAPMSLDERSEEHPSEIQSLMCISYAGFCL